MQQVLSHEVPFQSVQKALVQSFADVFGSQPCWIDKEDLNTMILNLSTQEKEKELSQNLTAK
jgi:hypothetical protein